MSALEPLSLLVVEDDDALRASIVELLELHGHRVNAAANGEEGLALAREVRPDVVITDIAMPVMDGFALVEALRADPDTDTIPIVFLTAKADRSDIRRGMDLGGDDYLVKPFTEAELLGALGARVARRASIERRAEAEIAGLRAAMRRSLPHELLTPLNGILGFAYLLEEGAATIKRERLAEWGSLIREAGERQLALIRKVLAHADVELTAGDAARLAVLLGLRTPHARQLIELGAKTAAGLCHRGADLRVEVDDAALAMGEASLEPVVRELVENAAKFSKTGTLIEVVGRADGDAYTLCVADAGRGMSAAEIAAIAPFVQFGRDRYQQRGLGLGLATARRLVLLHRGAFAIESAPEGGTTVTLSIPLAS